ncbi:hypothetical protein ACFFTM_14520 [Pseudoduganella plicata]|uniref:BcpO-related WXXGXW repeat protein n=1 Tax=Pseudoduganella plicata TaxID=321984 RepID=A0A4P7B986_9BURK|nr:YXWGXW repeat-containing protein [Pseudoduganella plicata]QBQ34874.1 hypothetical protein E1742_00740 [Pseudoduganella plicata]GGY89236.1 hypothetical protein GCM10007388_23390 [Pseudoduganella plicata]
MIKPTILAAVVLGAATLLPAQAMAQVDVNLVIGTAPPPLRYEMVPQPRSGYVWAPGYWAWDGYRHVWVGGNWLHERPGYAYAGPRWIERRGNWVWEQARWNRFSPRGDMDHDGVPNRYDRDRDGDGVPNRYDRHDGRYRSGWDHAPQRAWQHNGWHSDGRNRDGWNRGGRRDQDHDGVPNRYDRDRDGDGVPNRYDRDRDGDGVSNRRDYRPDNPYRN